VTLGSTTDLYNGLASGLDALWATNSDAQLLYRVDPGTLKLVAEIEAGFAPKGVLATPEGVWVADVHGGTVLRVDAATNEVADTVEVGPAGPSGPNWLADGLGSIWVDIPNNGTVTRFDPSTLQIQAAIAPPQGFTPCGGFAIEPEAVWLTSCVAGKLMARIDTQSRTRP
jgi:streptogramin lyase